MKKCCVCKEIKNDNDFYKCKCNKDGLQLKCKDCTKKYAENNKERIHQYKKDYARDHESEIKIKKKEYADLNKDKKRESDKIWREKNKDRKKEMDKIWRENNKERVYKRSKDYAEKNKEKIRLYSKNYRKIKNSTDPKARLKNSLRSRLKLAFKKYSKYGKARTCEEYGVDFEAIYNKVGPRPGSGKEWHLDHIIPLNAFDLDNPEHVRLANLPCNLRWLSASENESKRDYIIDYVYCSLVLFSILKYIGRCKK